MEFLIIGIGLLPIAIWGFVCLYQVKKEEQKEEKLHTPTTMPV